jgi:hypothetical protein
MAATIRAFRKIWVMTFVALSSATAFYLAAALGWATFWW